MNDLKTAAQTLLRNAFLSCVAYGFKFDVFESLFFPIILGIIIPIDFPIF